MWFIISLQNRDRQHTKLPRVGRLGYVHSIYQGIFTTPIFLSSILLIGPISHAFFIYSMLEMPARLIQNSLFDCFILVQISKTHNQNLLFFLILLAVITNPNIKGIVTKPNPYILISATTSTSFQCLLQLLFHGFLLTHPFLRFPISFNFSVFHRIQIPEISAEDFSSQIIHGSLQ